jgi:hypothetical protein
MVDAEYSKERQVWIDRYRALERQVTDPLAALLVHEIVSELEACDGAPCQDPPARDPHAPRRVTSSPAAR